MSFTDLRCRGADNLVAPRKLSLDSDDDDDDDAPVWLTWAMGALFRVREVAHMTNMIGDGIIFIRCQFSVSRVSQTLGHGSK